MKKTLGFAAAVVLAASALGQTPPKSKAHGLSVTGTVVSADAASKKMTVRSSSGKSVPFVWTDATKTAGGTVKAGAKVTVRYLEKDGKNIATSISIDTSQSSSAGAPPAAAPTPTATTAASSTKPR